MKNKKKGFTIVELVIVIAVIGILAAVLIPTFINLTNKANQAADQSLVKNLNTALATQEGLPEDKKNNTLHDAVLDLDAYGYKLENLAPKSDKEFVWDRNTNRFVFVSEVPEGKEYDYFKIQNRIEEGQKFSVYAGKDFDATSVELNGFGFDSGDKDNIANVSYANTNAREVVIRTNSVFTTLTIDAEHDTIHHYDALGALNIVKANTASYHENGKVAYVEIAYGRIVLEKGADVEEIHINKKNSSSFDTVIIANNGGTEELPGRITRDAVTVTEETLVVKVESYGSSENVYVYADGATGTKGSTQKITEGENKQNENVNSALGQLVLDNGATADKAQTEDEQAAAKTETVNEAIESVEYTGVAVTKVGESTQLMALDAFRDSVNGGNTYSGYTLKLLDDINLNNVDWTPIGTSDHPFSGVFDGQGYTISNLKVNSASGYAGLFGYIKGDMSNCPEKTDLPEGWDESSIAIVEANYTAAVKNLNIDHFEVKSSGGKKFCGTIAGYAEYALLSDLTVSNGLVNNTDKSYAGGIVGGTSAGMAFENLTVFETVEVKAGDHSVGGIVGGTNNDASNKSDISSKEFLVIFSNCTNKSNVSTTSSTGYAGGIVGHTSGGKTTVVVMNCYNRGEIKCQTLTGGIAGESDKVYMLFSCINYGKVWNDASSGNNFLGGITGKKSSGSMRIIACINNGEVTGYANNGNIAGIIGSASSTTIEGCVNRGVITNTKANGVSHEITSGADNVLVANETTYTVDSSVSGEMTKITITGDAATCTSIVIDNETIEKVFVAIDNFNGTITGLEGKTLYISGANSTVTIPQNSSIDKVVVSGTNCTIINNGTIGAIRFEVAGNNSIENNGTISNSANGAFTIASTTNGANVAITNNGTIAASGSEDAYALYFSSGAACVINNQNGTITGSNFGKVTVNQ